MSGPPAPCSPAAAARRLPCPPHAGSCPHTVRPSPPRARSARSVCARSARSARSAAGPGPLRPPGRARSVRSARRAGPAPPAPLAGPRPPWPARARPAHVLVDLAPLRVTSHPVGGVRSTTKGCEVGLLVRPAAPPAQPGPPRSAGPAAAAAARPRTPSDDFAPRRRGAKCDQGVRSATKGCEVRPRCAKCDQGGERGGGVGSATHRTWRTTGGRAAKRARAAEPERQTGDPTTSGRTRTVINR